MKRVARVRGNMQIFKMVMLCCQGMVRQLELKNPPVFFFPFSPLQFFCQRIVELTYSLDPTCACPNDGLARTHQRTVML